jgi:Predicted membrane protein (DUF2127)
VIELLEGTGLWLGKRWGEYFAMVATSIFLPYEIYDLTAKVTVTRVLFFIVNLALVLYLVLTKRLFGVRGGKRAYEARLRSESIMDAALARAAAAERASSPGPGGAGGAGPGEAAGGAAAGTGSDPGAGAGPGAGRSADGPAGASAAGSVPAAAPLASTAPGSVAHAPPPGSVTHASSESSDKDPN